MRAVLYIVLLVGAALSIGVLHRWNAWSLLGLVALPLALYPVRIGLSDRTGKRLLPLLGATARLEIAVGVLLTIGIVLGSSVSGQPVTDVPGHHRWLLEVHGMARPRDQRGHRLGCGVRQPFGLGGKAGVVGPGQGQDGGGEGGKPPPQGLLGARTRQPEARGQPGRAVPSALIEVRRVTQVGEDADR